LTRTLAVLGIIVVGGISIALAQGNSGIGGVMGQANAAYAIGVWGDLPYSAIQESVGLPNLIDDMNSQQLAFTVHDGDLKTGNAAPICDDALYLRALGWFNSLDAPAIFTPGDNDWVDCDRPNNGSFRSLERLSHERLFACAGLTRNPNTLVQDAAITDPDGYFDYLVALRNEVIAFQRPVAYVHGDSHYFRVDRPMLNANGVRLENFTRVETFGDNASNVTLTNDVQWVKVLVDPRSREVFAYQAQIVPGNRVAVPAP
jgi:hypothetical protein